MFLDHITIGQLALFVGGILLGLLCLGGAAVAFILEWQHGRGGWWAIALAVVGLMVEGASMLYGVLVLFGMIE